MAKKVLIAAALALGVAAWGCKTKDRLSSNTYSFIVAPPATSVVTGGTKTFTVEAFAPAGEVSTEADWTVTPSSADVNFNTVVGKSVIVTFNTAGNYLINAAFEDKSASSQVHVQ